MKIKTTTILELNKSEGELLRERYTRSIAKMISSELSLHEIKELIEKLKISTIY
jgi:hypothetical protein